MADEETDSSQKEQSKNILIPYYETLVPILHICRKIEKINQQQLIDFFMRLIDILEKNNHHALIQRMAQSITKSPIRNIKISISKYAHACNKWQFIFKYLNLKELAIIEPTCSHFKNCLINHRLQLYNLLSKSNCTRTCIMDLLTKNHIDFTPDLFNEIKDLLPIINETDINDTISKSCPESYTELVKIQNIIQIPEDVLIHIMNFLYMEELLKVDKICRYLCIISHNANSLYVLGINCTIQCRCTGTVNSTIDHEYLAAQYYHPRYHKPKFLYIARCTKNPHFMKKLPAFKHVQKFEYSNENVDDYSCNIKVLCARFVSFNHLRTIRVTSMLVNDVFALIIKCPNLQRLEFPYCCDETFTDNTYIKQEINELPDFPLNELEFILTNMDTLFYCSIQYFLYWLLGNGKKKTFSIKQSEPIYYGVTYDEFDSTQHNMDFFDTNIDYDCIPLLNMQKNALVNIGYLEVNYFSNVLLSIGKWIHTNNKIKFREFTLFIRPGDGLARLQHDMKNNTFSDVIKPLISVTDIMSLHIIMDVCWNWDWDMDRIWDILKTSESSDLYGVIQVFDNIYITNEGISIDNMYFENCTPMEIFKNSIENWFMVKMSSKFKCSVSYDVIFMHNDINWIEKLQSLCKKYESIQTQIWSKTKTNTKITIKVTF
eukprot:248880_1